MLGSRDELSPVPGSEPTCDVTELGTCLQITAGGELDLAAAPLLRAAANRATFAPGRVVLLDLTSASFLDSSVAHFALDLDRRATASGAELVIMVAPETKALFELLGTDRLNIVEENGAG